MKKSQYRLEKDFLNYIVHKDYYKFLKEELSKYIQHGNTTVFKHSRDVAFNAYKFANAFHNRFHTSFDFESLVNACYMHDMFMYDWHEKSTEHRLHGYTHPKVAALNAERYCYASDKETEMIKTHMWPLTITKIPKSREAWVLSLCDKATTIAEVFSK